MAVTLPSSSNNRLKLNPPKQQQQIERRLCAFTMLSFAEDLHPYVFDAGFSPAVRCMSLMCFSDTLVIVSPVSESM
jgi:hypothetical protein